MVFRWIWIRLAQDRGGSALVGSATCHLPMSEVLCMDHSKSTWTGSRVGLSEGMRQTTVHIGYATDQIKDRCNHHADRCVCLKDRR